MICPNCNSNIYDGSNFCPICGVKFERTEYESPVVPLSYEDQEAESVSNKLMVFGIVSLALSISGNGIPGIILSLIAKKQNTIYNSLTNRENTKASIGNILGKIGFWYGIGITVFSVLYIAFIFAIAFIPQLIDMYLY